MVFYWYKATLIWGFINLSKFDHINQNDKIISDHIKRLPLLWWVFWLAIENSATKIQDFSFQVSFLNLTWRKTRSERAMNWILVFDNFEFRGFSDTKTISDTSKTISGRRPLLFKLYLASELLWWRKVCWRDECNRWSNNYSLENTFKGI